MKHIKKWVAVALAVILCLSMTACAFGTQNSTATETLETSAVSEDGETTVEDKDPANYEDDIQGLCQYLEDCALTAGERVQMSYDVIGAVNGYKYTYQYNSSNIQLEVYEFPTEEISEIAQQVIDSVRENGSFEILDNTVPATISADGRYMLIYTDTKAEKEELNKKHKEHVMTCFEAFTAE